MTLPENLLGDKNEHPEDIFGLNPSSPRFVITLKDDLLAWPEGLDKAEREQTLYFIRKATEFYDLEIKRYQKPF